MLKVAVNALPLGSKLAKPLYSSTGQLLLRQGTFLAPSIMDRLLQHGITEVYLASEDPSSVDTEFPISDTTKNQELAKLFRYCQDAFQNFMTRVRSGIEPEIADVEKAVACLCDEVIRTTNVLDQLYLLREKDNYTLQHSVAVSLLSMKIGHLLKIPNDQLRKLGMSGLLHDIGKESIPLEILNKPGPLNKAEWDVMSKHPQLGQQILQNISLDDEFIKLVVLQHHERIDGSGYPHHYEAATIHDFSRVVAVADIFDAMTADRVYRSRSTPFMAADELIKQAFGPLDPRMTSVFLSYLINLSHGKKVRLSSGDLAEVMMIDKNEPNRTVVKVGKSFIDLKMNRDLTIQEIV